MVLFTGETWVWGDPAVAQAAILVSMVLGSAFSSKFRKILGLSGERASSSDPNLDSQTDPAMSGWQRAAKIFEKEGRFREAAQLYEGQGHHYEAAGLLLRAGALTSAADIFERAGDFLRAGQVCTQAGDNRRAGENYRRYLEDRFGSLVTTRSPSDHTEYRHYCRLAGDAFERAGLLEQAAEVLERGEHWEDAANLYLRLNRHVKAADLFQRAGAMDRAADVFAQSGDRARAALMRGEFLYTEEQREEAAVQFLLGGDPLRAATIYEENGNYLDAARCYEHCGSHRQAAEAYETVDQFDRAAEMYARCSDYDRAAELYEQADLREHAMRMYGEAGMYLKAAQIARSLDQIDVTIDYLQKVKSKNRDYPQALALLTRSFVDRKLPGVAIEKLKKAMDRQKISPENIELFYVWSQAYEAHGDLKNAIAILKMVVGENYLYEDSVDRLKDLEKRMLNAPTEIIVRDDTIQTDLAQGERYQFQEKIGAGGMGLVYRAFDLLLNRTVAYKMLMEQFMALAEVRERFLREARSAAGLNHVNIVTVYDVGVDRGRLFISMEYVNGLSYFEVLQRDNRLTTSQVLHFVSGVLKALIHAHQNGVIHRDIKPSNVMLTDEGTVKIMDFGLAKVLDEAKSQSDRASGTPLYMSPEQILGKELDFRTDMYAFGGTVYHLLAGEPPFLDGEVLYHHVHTEPRRLKDLRPEVPNILSDIVMQCLSKNPLKRPTPEEIISRLRKKA